MKHSNELILSLQSKIILEENVPVACAAILAENALFRFDERVQTGVVQWVKGELTDAFAVEDISLKDIQDEIGVSTFQALCVMDIYLKNADFLPVANWFEIKEVFDHE